MCKKKHIFYEKLALRLDYVGEMETTSAVNNYWIAWHSKLKTKNALSIDSAIVVHNFCIIY